MEPRLLAVLEQMLIALSEVNRMLAAVLRSLHKLENMPAQASISPDPNAELHPAPRATEESWHRVFSDICPLCGIVYRSAATCARHGGSMKACFAERGDVRA
jgi:hypothetical protein